MRFSVRLLLVSLPCLLAGCGGKAPVEVHPVRGRIFYGENPAAGVVVYFLPTSAPTVPDIPMNPRGVTDAGGNFALTTYQPEDGAAEGGYKVVLSWPRPGTEEEESRGDVFLGWYDGVHSKLTVRIKAGENRLAEFRLPVVNRPPDAVEGVPGRN